MDFQTLKIIYDDWRETQLPYYLNIYKRLAGDTTERGKYLKGKWRTNIHSRIVQTYTQIIHSMMLDSGSLFKITSRKNNDKLADILLDLIEYIFTRSESYVNLYDNIKTAIAFGTGYFKVGYRNVEVPFQYYGKGGKKKTGVDKDDYPTLDYVSPISLIVDKSASSPEDARYWIERNVISVNSFQEKYGFFDIKITKDLLEKGTYIDAIDRQRYTRDLLMSTIPGQTDINQNEYLYLKEKNVEVFEIHERDGITIFVNGKQFGPYPQIGPYRKPKYYPIQYIKIPGSFIGIGIGTIVSAIEDMQNALINMRMDNVKIAGNKMLMHIRSLDPILNEVDEIEVEPGKIIHISDVNALLPFNMGDVPTSPIVEFQNLQNMVQEALGISGYGIGIQEKVERSASGVSALQQAQLNRLKELIASIQRAMAFVAKYWVILAMEYMDDDILERVLGTEGKNMLRGITIEDIIQDFDFEFEIEALKVQQSSVKMQQAIQLLQAVGGLTDAEGKPLIDIKKITETILEGLGLSTEFLYKQENNNLNGLDFLNNIGNINNGSNTNQSAELPQTPEIPLQSEDKILSGLIE